RHELFNEQRSEKKHQIPDGERKKAFGGLASPFAAPPQAHRESYHNGATRDRGRRVQGTAEAEKPWQQGSREQEQRIDQNASLGFALAGDAGQRRDSGSRVISGSIERQSQKMRRRPEEHHEEQKQRLKIYLTGNSDPGDHGGRRAGCTADDDALRRRALQPY